MRSASKLHLCSILPEVCKSSVLNQRSPDLEQPSRIDPPFNNSCMDNSSQNWKVTYSHWTITSHLLLIYVPSRKTCFCILCTLQMKYFIGSLKTKIRYYKINWKIPDLSSCCFVRPKSTKTYLRASVIPNIFRGLYPRTFWREERPSHILPRSAYGPMRGHFAPRLLGYNLVTLYSH